MNPPGNTCETFTHMRKTLGMPIYGHDVEFWILGDCPRAVSWRRLATCCFADWQSADRPSAPAGCQPATQQTASLRYGRGGPQKHRFFEKLTFAWEDAPCRND